MDKDEKIDEIKKSIYGLKDSFKPNKFTSSFNSNYVEYRSDGDEDKILSIKEYLDEVRPYVSDIINEHKNKDEWKIQINLSINFISSKICNGVRTMNTKSDIVDIMTGVDTNDIVEELFKSTLKRHEAGFQESMRESQFVFDCVNELHYKLHKVDLNRGMPYIDSPKRSKNKKATINTQNMDDDRYFQYALTVTLNYEKIKNHPKRTKNIEPFIDQYNWDEINFPSDQKDWKEFESNNKSVAIIVLYVSHNTKKIRHACKSKYNLRRENQVILLRLLMALNCIILL